MLTPPPFPVPQAEVDRLGNVIVDPSMLEKHFRTPSKLHFSAHSMWVSGALRNALWAQTLVIALTPSLPIPPSACYTQVRVSGWLARRTPATGAAAASLVLALPAVRVTAKPW